MALISILQILQSLANRFDSTNHFIVANLINDLLIKISTDGNINELPTKEEALKIIEEIANNNDLDAIFKYKIENGEIDPAIVVEIKSRVPVAEPYNNMNALYAWLAQTRPNFIEKLINTGLKIKSGLAGWWSNDNSPSFSIYIPIKPRPISSTGPLTMRQIELATRNNPIVNDLLNELSIKTNKGYMFYNNDKDVKLVLLDVLKELFGEPFIPGTTLYQKTHPDLVQEKQLKLIDALWYLGRRGDAHSDEEYMDTKWR